MPFTQEQIQTAMWLIVGAALMLLLVLLGPVLMPFVTGTILAYMLNPLVDAMCRVKWKKWAIPRQLAALIAMLLLMSSILALILIVLPVAQNEFPLLQEQIPRFLDQLHAILEPRLLQLGIHIQLDSNGIKQLISDHLATSGQEIGHAILSSLKVGGTAVLGMIASVLLIPMVLYYLLVDWHALLARLHHLIPRKWVKRTTQLAEEVDGLLAQYLRGQLLVMLVLAIYYSSALALTGFNAALPVGILTGLLVFIPYIGFGLGLFLALITAVLQFNGLHGLAMVALIYGTGQIMEGFYLTPRLVGERIGLQPLTVIFALLAFGQLFGFVGILLALPASAITSVAIKHLRSLYFKSRFYTVS